MTRHLKVEVIPKVYRYYILYTFGMMYKGDVFVKKVKGAFTLEATIVISSILIILCAVFYAFMLLYQNAVISYSASYAASEGAKSWVENREGDRYWRLKEFGTITSGSKINEVKAIAENCLKKGVIAGAGNNVNVVFENSFGMRKITVEISQDLNVPFAGIAKYFNDGETLKLKAKASANVAEPTEYIRNIDYGVEWVSTISSWIGEKIGDKLEGNKAFDTIKTLFGL